MLYYLIQSLYEISAVIQKNISHAPVTASPGHIKICVRPIFPRRAVDRSDSVINVVGIVEPKYFQVYGFIKN